MRLAARMAFGSGIAYLASVYTTPSTGLVGVAIGSLLLAFGAIFGWEDQ